MATQSTSETAPFGWASPVGEPALSQVDQVVAGRLPGVETAAMLPERTVAMNEALVRGAVHQHELTEVAENLNAQLRAEIEARKKTAEELREKARLLDLSMDAIIVRDHEGRILYWNHGATELYGWSREEAMGKLSHVLLRSEYPVPIERITEQLHRDNHWTGELVHRHRDGRRMTVLIRKVQDRDDDGNPAAVLQTITDITERKKIEDELLQARTRLADHARELEVLVTKRTAALTAVNQQMEAFVYSIAHDLRAPLRSMQGFAALLGGDVGTTLSASGREFVRRIDQSTQFMDAMLIDLLAFSQISQQQIELRPVNLAPVVAAVLARLQNDIRGKNAQVENTGPWPAVLAHEPTLAQVLFNLTGNALKFVAPGVPPQVRLRAEAREGFIRVWVEDNGPGIAPEDADQIFRLFNRLHGAKYPGTGIGLTIVKKGVERMGGRVGVESTPGQGSRFWIELAPAVVAGPAPGRAAA